MKAIILAAGLGTRLGEMGKSLPKCLIEINGKSLLKWQFECLETAGIKREDVIVVIGKEGECWTEENIKKIKKLSIKVLVNEKNMESSNSHSLKIALREVGEEDILIMDGDLIFIPEIALNMINFSKSTILSKTLDIYPEARNKLILNEEGRVLELNKKIPKETLIPPYKIYGAMIKIVSKEIDNLKKTLQKERYNFEALDIFLNEFCKTTEIYSFSNNNWVNINKIENILEGNKILGKKFIILMFGYTAVGKSTLAKKISERLNAKIFHSAVIRKELNLTPKSLAEADKFFDYRNNLRQEIDKLVYKKLAENAFLSLKKGENVVLDAGYFFKWQRQLIYEIAKETGSEVIIIRVICSDEEEIKKRIFEREKNFNKDPLSETPSWNTYLVTKEITERIEGQEEKSIAGMIEYNSLTNKADITINKDSKNLCKIFSSLT